MKTIRLDKYLNIAIIRHPHWHFHPVFAFIRGPTNYFVTNHLRATFIVTILSAHFSISAILTKEIFVELSTFLQITLD